MVKDLGLPSGYLHVTQITGVEKARFLHVLMEIGGRAQQGYKEAKERPGDQKMISE